MASDPKHLSDEELITTYRNSGNRELPGVLFRRYSLLCFTVCMKYLKDEMQAEDASMEIFEKLFEDLKIHEIQNFRNWLHSVARNYCLMQLRKPNLLIRIQEEENEVDFMENIPELHPSNEKEDLEFRLTALEDALKQLNVKQQACIRYFYLEQMSYEEISRKTGFSVSEVKSFIQNGKRNLKIILGKSGISNSMFVLIWLLQNA